MRRNGRRGKETSVRTQLRRTREQRLKIAGVKRVLGETTTEGHSIRRSAAGVLSGLETAAWVGGAKQIRTIRQHDRTREAKRARSTASSTDVLRLLRRRPRPATHVRWETTLPANAGAAHDQPAARHRKQCNVQQRAHLHKRVQPSLRTVFRRELWPCTWASSFHIRSCRCQRYMNSADVNVRLQGTVFVWRAYHLQNLIGSAPQVGGVSYCSQVWGKPNILPLYTNASMGFLPLSDCERQRIHVRHHLSPADLSVP